MRRHYRRHIETAGNNGSVRADAAEIGKESGEMMTLELNDVGRREIVGDYDGLLLRAGRSHAARLAQQHFKHTLDDLHHVSLALAQVEILDGVELLYQHAHLLRQRPLGVAQFFGDRAFR